ncbi:aldehyde dehydrogenase family protein (plasmid) [Rhizobium leguminosarum bv. trifolii]|jgi:betaine-aldehyde dehydrogenase|uniref:Aldehyde dehydrogenase family protein n=1 Tax=Rhizobium ruizarguesonis TaxID=2081791 RepID=A0AB38I052_9HYPH|nr:aldehyde dehydrogenase family protein [Rhizobium ruizarguesonis]MBY5887136.1 aldehyde dehydrogenase family protein [Rhizobium leguminosarum]NKL42399.1 aldehyde dehydrogenase family protein [Rhizobium leguminosarum bv. viciae]QIO48024.1 aldehyde dehydrogenase family protein [Rhizobium leguminosarum bv. trifolii]NEH28703.1 aldehyde dehydrogenase family protein [Rhizobium ruizarguesonis]NEH62619.1 aldehyde dehydrogenase family protein [Rhizobium ruizarguesonis]
MRSELYIDGQWVKPAKGGTCEVINPATEEVIHRIAAATAEDVDLAVKAARRAFDRDGWPKLTGARRAGYLRAIADGIRARQAEIARLEVLDNGKPFPEADWDVADAAGCFDFYAGLAEQLDNNPEEAIALPDARFTSKAVREPIGVAGAIIPWNYPLLMAAWKVAPALAAGCTVVLKPAELTSLTALELAAVADEAGLPAGVLNIVTGAGSIAGQAIIDHRQVDKLAFTGSGPVGSKIMAAAARDIKRVSLELGGKSPFVVFEDADIDKAVEWIMFGIFWNQGQVCSATSRVLVHEAIYGRLLERLVEETNRIKIGNGLDEGTLLGPLVSKRQYDQVVAAIEGARKAGATVACGGTRPEGFDRGFYLRPTVLADVPLDSDAWKEEIFGPVVCVRSFKTEEEAVELANDSRFGLAAAVMSKDDTRAERVAAAFRAGIVWINCSQPTFTEAPWGGYKESGIGRELGRWGLDNYLETKQITRFASEAPWGWYIKPEAAE